ncbi:FCD domain-containing protein [Anaerobacillus sp. CMMVII]|uniref:FCD domain-containing protein n=1 Tax=Anaerobacillus sp. CMMVII TaxID=2755588 RepID=UPI0021B77909|nr:FCD domain-containing protein [Anaerobacillus sp. CMMVII]MCT8140505.1 FCD domain-containing protein [Anaerobacillus sp. CMMVII]
MFHHLLYDISRNKTATQILYQLNDHISRYRRLGPIRSEQRSSAAVAEHVELFELIKKRDADGAELAMRKHIENSLNSAVASIEVYLQSLLKEEQDE